MKCVLVRYSEIGIKSSSVRREMEKTLVKNIKDCLKKNSIRFEKIKRKRGRIIVYTEDEKALKSLRKVFGIANLSIAEEIETDIDKIIEEAKKLVNGEKFRVTAQRLNKNFKLTSQEINTKVGAEINGKVDLENFDINVQIEIMDDHAYVFSKRVNAVGGLPVGTQGRVLCLIDKDPRSVSACVQIMKRGSEPVLFVTEKADYKKIYEFSWGTEILVKEVEKLDFEKLNEFAEETECTAIVTGDSVKQVKKWEEFDSKVTLPVLRPIVVRSY